jgi:hypothetical protein
MTPAFFDTSTSHCAKAATQASKLIALITLSEKGMPRLWLKDERG